MIGQVRGLRVITGYRSLPKGDVDELARVVSAFSTIGAAENAVREAEINPLLIKREGEGVVALDILLVSDAEKRR